MEPQAAADSIPVEPSATKLEPELCKPSLSEILESLEGQPEHERDAHSSPANIIGNESDMLEDANSSLVIINLPCMALTQQAGVVTRCSGVVMENTEEH